MLAMYPHKNTGAKKTMDLMKLKTYQSLLFCPAYLFSLEDLKRRWWVVTFFLEIMCGISFMFRCKAIKQKHYMKSQDFG